MKFTTFWVRRGVDTRLPQTGTHLWGLLLAVLGTANPLSTAQSTRKERLGVHRSCSRHCVFVAAACTQVRVIDSSEGRTAGWLANDYGENVCLVPLSPGGGNSFRAQTKKVCE